MPIVVSGHSVFVVTEMREIKRRVRWAEDGCTARMIKEHLNEYTTQDAEEVKSKYGIWIETIQDSCDGQNRKLK